MPASNIYIDFSTSNTSTGATDVTSELTLATADNIGAANLPVVVQFATTTSGYEDAVVSYVSSATTSGAENVAHDYYSASTTISGFADSSVSYSLGTGVTSGTLDLIGVYVVPDVLGAGYGDVYTDYLIGQAYPGADDIAHEIWIPIVYSGTGDYEADYVAGFKIPFYKDSHTAFTMGTTASGFTDASVDLTFAGYVFHDMPVDLFSSSLTTSGLAAEATVISGSVDGIGTDIMASLSGIASFITESFCSQVINAGFNFDATTISGGLDYIGKDVFCSTTAASTIECDIDLLSLKIDNFSLGVGQWDQATSTISVDVTDDMYSVTASGCYFEVAGTPVSVTTSGITDGYRIFYDPVNDFDTIDGPAVITAHGENSNGDVLEVDYNLTFGYIVEYTNYERFGWHYGQGTKVLVRMSAENLANCPEFSADAYWFETKEKDRRELTASIVGEYSYDGSNDLKASIYPQSTAYFYGKVFRVKLNAKDLAGNEMEPLEFEFKVEDKP
jgi:hypothetical protein